jgi:hypothetical protein
VGSEVESDIGEKDGKVVPETSGEEFGVDADSYDISILMRVWFCFLLSVPFSGANLQYVGCASVFIDAMRGSEHNSWSNKRPAALEEIDLFSGHVVRPEDGYHAGPLAELGLSVSEALDPRLKTVGVPPAALWRIQRFLGFGRDVVGVLAADIEESRAFAVLCIESSEPVPDVDEARSVRDDGAVAALIVRDALVAKLRGIFIAVFESAVNLNGSFLHLLIARRFYIIRRSRFRREFLHDLHNNVNTATADSAARLSAVISTGPPLPIRISENFRDES